MLWAGPICNAQNGTWHTADARPNLPLSTALPRQQERIGEGSALTWLQAVAGTSPARSER